VTSIPSFSLQTLFLPRTLPNIFGFRPFGSICYHAFLLHWSTRAFYGPDLHVSSSSLPFAFWLLYLILLTKFIVSVALHGQIKTNHWVQPTLCFNHVRTHRLQWNGGRMVPGLLNNKRCNRNYEYMRHDRNTGGTEISAKEERYTCHRAPSFFIFRTGTSATNNSSRLFQCGQPSR